MALSVSWWRMKASSFSQYPRLSESYRIWKGGHGSPFVVPSTLPFFISPNPTTHPVVAGAEQVGGHEVLRPLKETEEGRRGHQIDQRDAHLVRWRRCSRAVNSCYLFFTTATMTTMSPFSPERMFLEVDGMINVKERSRDLIWTISSGLQR